MAALRNATSAKVAPNEPAVWEMQGNYFSRTKEWDAAIECLTRATQLAPDNKDYQKKLGFALARSGRIDEGYAMLTRCMGEAEARYNIARMLQHLEQPMACRWYLQMALQADPNYEPAREALTALTTDGTPVRPVAYTEAAAPAVQNATYAEPTAQPAQTTPIVVQTTPTVIQGPPTVAQTAPIVVQGSPTVVQTTAAVPPGQLPVIIVNKPADVPAPAVTPPAVAPAVKPAVAAAPSGTTCRGCRQ